MTRVDPPRAGRHFVSKEQRTPDYLAAIKALEALDSGLRTFAYAEAVCQEHLDSWARSRRLKPSSSEPCRRLLFGKRCTMGYADGCPDHDLPDHDHVSVWHREGHHVIVSQPYGLSEKACREIADLSDLGIHVNIDTWPAWHFPGTVLQVEFWSAGAYASWTAELEAKRRDPR